MPESLAIFDVGPSREDMSAEAETADETAEAVPVDFDRLRAAVDAIFDELGIDASVLAPTAMPDREEEPEKKACSASSDISQSRQAEP